MSRHTPSGDSSGGDVVVVVMSNSVVEIPKVVVGKVGECRRYQRNIGPVKIVIEVVVIVVRPMVPSRQS